MYPEYEEIMRLAPDYHIIPVCKEIYADVIRPITLLRKIAAVSKRYYLLESVEGRRKMAAFSDGANCGIGNCKDRSRAWSRLCSVCKRICAEDESGRGRSIKRWEQEQMQIGVLKKIFVKEKTKNEKTS